MTRLEEFEDLAEAWDSLVEGMTRPSPYLLHGWLAEHWRHRLRGARAAVVVVADGSELRAGAAFELRRRAGVTVATLMGGRYVSHRDVVLPAGDAAAAGPLVGCFAEAGFDCLDSYGVLADAELVRHAPAGRLRVVPRAISPVLELVGDRAQPATRRHRRRLRAARRELAATTEVARTPAEVERALEDAFTVHARRWAAGGDASGFASSEGRAFHRAALLRLAASGRVRLSTLRGPGGPLAFSLDLVVGTRMFGYRTAFDPRFARFSPGTLLLADLLELAYGDGIRIFEFGAGAVADKAGQGDRVDVVYQAVGLAHSRRGSVAAGALFAARRGRRAWHDRRATES